MNFFTMLKTAIKNPGQVYRPVDRQHPSGDIYYSKTSQQFLTYDGGHFVLTKSDVESMWDKAPKYKYYTQ